jgi:hypothetical protein
MATEIKFFQIRDEGTHIPCLATRIRVETHSTEMLRAGWRPGNVVVYLMMLNTLTVQYDYLLWENDPRTMPTAHKHIEENWKRLRNHQVIDVEFILGETDKPKEPE